ncbi:MAG: hypothetical protein K8H86_11020, partial [Ignavibacteriaceae bacterium]|nr:hypothetical protein [Ignavibacteriaceae bacterium]
ILNISNELEQNSNKLLYSIDYHKILEKSIDSIWANTPQKDLNKKLLENKGFSQIPNWKGIGLSKLNTSSYNSALISNIFPGMQPDIVESVSKTYQDIEIYNSIREKILNRFYNIDSNTKYIDVLLIIEIIKGDVIDFENKLHKEITNLTKLLNKKFVE